MDVTVILKTIKATKTFSFHNSHLYRYFSPLVCYSVVLQIILVTKIKLFSTLKMLMILPQIGSKGK